MNRVSVFVFYFDIDIFSAAYFCIFYIKKELNVLL